MNQSQIERFVYTFNNLWARNERIISRGVLAQEVWLYMHRNNIVPQSVDDVRRCAFDFLESINLGSYRAVMESVINDPIFDCIVLFFDYQSDQYLSSTTNFLEKLADKKRGYSFENCLLWAVKLGSTDKAVSKIIRINNLQISGLDSYDVAPIHIVAQRNNYPMMQIFTDHWRRYGDDVLERAVQQKDRHGNSAIYHAAMKKFPNMVDLLIECGATKNMIDGTDWFYRLLSNGNSFVQDLVSKEPNLEMLLSSAVAEGSTAIHMAASRGYYNLVAPPLGVEELEMWLKAKDSNGFSVMERFLEYSWEHGVREFMITINQYDRDWTENIFWSALQDVPNKFLMSDACLELIKDRFEHSERIVKKIESIQQMKSNHQSLNLYFETRIENLIQQANWSPTFFRECKSLCDQIISCHQEEERTYNMYNPAKKAEEAFRQFHNALQENHSIPETVKEFFVGNFERMIEDMEMTEIYSVPDNAPANMGDATALLSRHRFQE